MSEDDEDDLFCRFDSDVRGMSMEQQAAFWRAEALRLGQMARAWMAEAKNYAGNADYWRERAESLSRL